MPVDVVINIPESVIIEAVVLAHVCEKVFNPAHKVCEQHLVVNEHSVAEEVVDERLQLLPMVEVVDLLLQVALQQLAKLVSSDWLCGFVEEPGGFLVGTVENPGASLHVGFVSVLFPVLVNFVS